METMPPYESAAPPVVTLELEGPRPQRRWTIALRAILAIPHGFWLWILSFAYWLAVSVAWFAALVLGRMPDGLGTFLSRLTQYYGRVTAYGSLLLTDAFPSFALDEPDYPVSVRVPWGGRLNRAAVFFRIVLILPAAIASWLVFAGVGICMVFIWLIVLVSGRMPASLFEALAAVLRYQLRVGAYYSLLTSEYPRGLFGDRGLAADVDAPLPMAPSAEALVPPTPTSAAWPVDAEAPVAAPRITTLVLSKAAKRIVVLFIVLGVVFIVAMGAVSAMAANEAQQARDELGALYADLGDSSLEYGDAQQACALNQGGLSCLQNAARDYRLDVEEFGDSLDEVDFPATALSAANDVLMEVGDVIDVLDGLLASADGDEYQQTYRDLQTELQQLDQSVEELDLVLVRGY